MAEGAVGGPSAAGRSELTIGQLASETGMSVRNIRSYRSRRILPAPVVRAGVGYYGEEYVARIRRIVELQAQGLKLSQIERLFAGGGPSFEQLAELTRVISAPFETNVPEVLSRDELVGRVGAVEQRDIVKAENWPAVTQDPRRWNRTRPATAPRSRFRCGSGVPDRASPPTSQSPRGGRQPSHRSPTGATTKSA